MIDLNSGSNAHAGPLTLSDRINDVIDAALIERRKSEPKRRYLGMSQIGEECERKLCYSYAQTPPERELTARSIRIFDTGHAGEDATALQIGARDLPQTAFFTDCAAKWLADAGFRLVTRNKDGKQFEATALDGRYGGHIDGCLLDGPLPDLVPYPVGWEHKALNVKNWNKIKKHGVLHASPLYYGQMQEYMAYFELKAYLFTATNKNSQELHHELVPFDARAAQELSDKAIRIIECVEAGNLLPRCTNNPDYFVCKFCDWSKRCWHEDGC